MELGQINFGRSWMKYLIFLSSIMLFACTGGRFVPTDPIKMPRKVPGTADARVVALQHKLAGKNVKVITIGQEYLVSIPSAIIFPNQSPQLTWQSYIVLNQVVNYLKQYRKIVVNVTGYSSPYVSTRREEALSLARAKAVSNYLWSQGIDCRFIFAEGAGRDKPISAYQAGGDFSVNSRIEITFTDAII